MLRKDIDTLKELVSKYSSLGCIADDDINFLEKIIDYEETAKKKHSSYVSNARDDEFHNITNRMLYYKRKEKLNPLQQVQLDRLQEAHDKYIHSKMYANK